MATSTAARAANETTPRDVLTWLARAGYAARGVVYLLVGGLAAWAVFGAGGETTDARGALSRLAAQPFGQVMLGIVGVGLIGYALWRFLQAHYDLDNHGRDAKGLAIRLGMGVSAITHLLLATWAFTVVISATQGDGGDSQQRWVAWLLRQPGGRWWVALIGLLIAGVGIAHAVKGWKAKFEKHLSLDYDRWPWARTVCRIGLVARGVVFVIIGWFFMQAAFTQDPSEAGGLEQVLDWLQSQPWGSLILVIMALGLVAFGVYSLIEAVYRRIHPPHEFEATPA